MDKKKRPNAIPPRSHARGQEPLGHVRSHLRSHSGVEDHFRSRCRAPSPLEDTLETVLAQWHCDDSSDLPLVFVFCVVRMSSIASLGAARMKSDPVLHFSTHGKRESVLLKLSNQILKYYNCDTLQLYLEHYINVFISIEHVFSSN